jgi:hypothetical protein
MGPHNFDANIFGVLHGDPLLSGKLSSRFSHKFAEIRSLNLDA